METLNGLLAQGMSILAGFGVLVIVLLIIVIGKVLQRKNTRSSTVANHDQTDNEEKIQ